MSRPAFPPCVGSVVIAGSRGSEVLFEVLRPGVGMAVWGRTARARLGLAEIAALPAVPAFDVDGRGRSSTGWRPRCWRRRPAPCPRRWARTSRGWRRCSPMVALSVAVRCRLRGLPPGGDLRFPPEPAGLRLVCAHQGPGIDWLLPSDGPARAARPVLRGHREGRGVSQATVDRATGTGRPLPRRGDRRRPPPARRRGGVRAGMAKRRARARGAEPRTTTRRASACGVATAATTGPRSSGCRPRSGAAWPSTPTTPGR